VEGLIGERVIRLASPLTALLLYGECSRAMWLTERFSTSQYCLQE